MSPVITRYHLLSPVVTRYYPLSSVLTRLRQLSSVTPVVTRYHPSSLVVTCLHPLQPASHWELLIDTEPDIFCFILAKCWVGGLDLVVAGETVYCVGSWAMQNWRRRRLWVRYSEQLANRLNAVKCSETKAKSMELDTNAFQLNLAKFSQIWWGGGLNFYVKTSSWPFLRWEVPMF